jgi:hypothetical protein
MVLALNAAGVAGEPDAAEIPDPAVVAQWQAQAEAGSAEKQRARPAGIGNS